MRWYVFFLPGCFRHRKTSLALLPWIAAELEREARISDLKASICLSISNPLDKVCFAINTWWKMRGFKDSILPFLEDAKSQLGQLFPLLPDSSYHFYLALFYFFGIVFIFKIPPVLTHMWHTLNAAATLLRCARGISSINRGPIT